jgi:hypothetical protein
VKEYTSRWTSSSSSSAVVGATYDINKLNGYSNTKAIKEYNTTATSVPIELLSPMDNNFSDIENTSGWYLPSAREIIYLWGGSIPHKDTYYGTYYDANLSTLNEYLTTTGNDNINTGKYYWTSSEYDGTHSYVIIMHSTNITSVSYIYKHFQFQVRPICAF